MLPTDKLSIPGEYPFNFKGAVGQLEGVLAVPEHARVDYMAILGHPHSLQGGTMNNKVVTTMARAFKELSIPSLRFNFRGVGLSEGVYNEGIGESEDMVALTRYWQQQFPAAKFIFAGFSFGSYVTYRAAAQYKHSLLISIAPPVHHYNYTDYSPAPWIILQGDDDDVSPLQLVLEFAEQVALAAPVLRFSDTGHFFHGKLIELKSRLIDAIRTQIL